MGAETAALQMTKEQWTQLSNKRRADVLSVNIMTWVARLEHLGAEPPAITSVDARDHNFHLMLCSTLTKGHRLHLSDAASAFQKAADAANVLEFAYRCDAARQEDELKFKIDPAVDRQLAVVERAQKYERLRKDIKAAIRASGELASMYVRFRDLKPEELELSVELVGPENWKAADLQRKPIALARVAQLFRDLALVAVSGPRDPGSKLNTATRDLLCWAERVGISKLILADEILARISAKVDQLFPLTPNQRDEAAPPTTRKRLLKHFSDIAAATRRRSGKSA